MCNFNVLNKCRRLKLCIKTLKVQSHEIPGGRGGSPMVMIYTPVVSPKVARPRREEKGGKLELTASVNIITIGLPPLPPGLPPASFKLGFNGATS
jgi:hypothetical protein